MMSLPLALAASGAIAAVGLTFNAADLWRLSPRFIAFFDWRIIGHDGRRLLSGKLSTSTIEVVASGQALRVSMLGQVIGAWLFVVFAWNSVWWGQSLSSTVVFWSSCHERFRLSVGLDGADQMQAVLWASLALVSVGGDSPVATLALLFLVAQVALSYLVSGIAKLSSPIWRKGQAVKEIVSTREYGAEWARHAVQPTWVSWLACWSVILFEVVGPLLLLAGRPAAYAFVAVGLGFHMMIWIIMGLRSFVFAFVATYPVVLAALDIIPSVAPWD